MVGAPGKRLIFTLAGIRFVLDLDHVVEVLEQLAGRLDSRRSDLRKGIVGALDFRHTVIPLIDPTLMLGLVSAAHIFQRSVLVLCGSEGNWAVLVDRVEGLAPADSFRRAIIPPLFQSAPGFAGAEVVLAEDAPLMVFEPERFYGINRDLP
ncbi:MAG: chemotaxis protein CheW [Desulfuromonadales bacterium]|nr:chemotaxis protein CheW [Desulfuromonadales bacterium]